MGKSRRELWYALLAMVIVVAAYAPISDGLASPPRPGSPAGILLGATGLLFILATESLYSFRKRSRRAAPWGRSESWLRFHIFTGIVGPFMILLHSAFSFDGLASMATLLMAATVASGFVGRYIYTLLPRSTAGIELAVADLDGIAASAGRGGELCYQTSSLIAVRRAFALWHAIHVPLQMAFLAATAIHVGSAIYYAMLAR